MPYVQMFIGLYQERDLGKTYKMCIVTMSEELKDTFLIPSSRGWLLSLENQTKPIPKVEQACVSAHSPSQRATVTM